MQVAMKGGGGKKGRSCWVSTCSLSLPAVDGRAPGHGSYFESTLGGGRGGVADPSLVTRQPRGQRLERPGAET
eukprot:1418235-Pyramimonas_sp.AAC.1